MSTSINDVSFVDYLTPALRNDQVFYCMALTLDPLFADIRAQIINNNFLPRLQNQSSALLDFLAHYHFNVDVYDDTLDPGIKLKLIQNVIINKIKKGTPAAVKAAMNTVFNYCELIEWYNDTPPAPANTMRAPTSGVPSFSSALAIASTDPCTSPLMTSGNSLRPAVLS